MASRPTPIVVPFPGFSRDETETKGHIDLKAVKGVLDFFKNRKLVNEAKTSLESGGFQTAGLTDEQILSRNAQKASTDNLLQALAGKTQPVDTGRTQPVLPQDEFIAAPERQVGDVLAPPQDLGREPVIEQQPTVGPQDRNILSALGASGQLEGTAGQRFLAQQLGVGLTTRVSSLESPIPVALSTKHNLPASTTFNQFKALGLDEDTSDRAGKAIGSIVEIKDKDRIITKEVIGHNEDGTNITKTIADAPRLASETAAPLTDRALDLATLNFLETGTIPAVGRGAKNRTAIVNNAPKVLQQLGRDASDFSVAARQMIFSSEKKNLGELKSLRGKVLAFEETANLNLDIAQNLSETFDRTGVPIFNAWVNAGRRAVTGNPELAKFDAAIRVAINEVAKITSSATGGQVTSDTARAEFEDLLKAAQTPEQFRGVVETLQADMRNRETGLNTQIEQASNNIRLFNPKRQKQETPQIGKGAQIKDKKTGTIHTWTGTDWDPPLGR